jgi:hypothetical protein
MVGMGGNWLKAQRDRAADLQKEALRWRQRFGSEAAATCEHAAIRTAVDEDRAKLRRIGHFLAAQDRAYGLKRGAGVLPSPMQVQARA